MNITLIIPCYNEAANLQKGVLDKIGNYTRNDDRFMEVVIVDDGSDDESRTIVKTKYLNVFPKFRLIANKHAGKAFAVITGIERAKGDYVFFTDMDLATPIEECEKLLDYATQGYEVVIGSRNTHREGAPLSRKILALGFMWTRNFIIGLRGIKDTQCGFKMFSTVAAHQIINRLKVFNKSQVINTPSVTAGFDLEFLFLAKKLKYKIKEVHVTWRHVETKRVAFVKDALETLRDIIRIKYYDLQGQYEKPITTNT